MRITERLKVEHGVFLAQLKHLEGLARGGASREVLQAVTESIAVAEEQHSFIEERLLYPALTKSLGEVFPPLQAVAAEHGQIRRLVQVIRGGNFDDGSVLLFVSLLRGHLEREIHGLFALAEETLSAEQLTGMCNWDAEHVYEEAGKRDLWRKKLSG